MGIEDLFRQRFWFSKAKVELSEATFFLGMGELTDELLGLFFREVKVDG